jgi:hypothetical protein
MAQVVLRPRGGKPAGVISSVWLASYRHLRLTTACSRRLPASAALPLSGAAEAQRSACFRAEGMCIPVCLCCYLYGGACKTFDGRRRAIAASSPVPLDAGQIGDGTAIVDFEREVVGELFGAQRRDGRFPRWSLHGSSDVTSQGYLEISDSCSASFHLLCRRFNYE